MSLPKLWFLAPKHAVQRVEEDGKPFQEMVDLISNAVTTVMAREFANQPQLEVGDTPEHFRKYIERIIKADAKNYVSAEDFVKSHAYFFLKRPELLDHYPGPETHKELVRREFTSCLTDVYTESNSWTHDSLAAATEKAIAAIRDHPVENPKDKPKKKEIWRLLRAMLTGGEKGPSLIETMEMLPPGAVLDRVRNFR